MAQMKRPRLRAVEVLPDYRLRLTFIDGSVHILRFAEFFEESPGLAPLKDPDAFSKATLIPAEGWTVEWPELDIQIGADTLWLDAQAQNAPDENTRFFAQWRARHGLSLAEAARALGMTPRTMSAYGTGKRPVPRYIALACKGWEAEQRSKFPETIQKSG
jgi:DNA-binding XRE family transcriptional regulator